MPVKKSLYLRLFEEYAEDKHKKFNVSWDNYEDQVKNDINKVVELFSRNSFFIIEFANDGVYPYLDTINRLNETAPEIFTKNNINALTNEFIDYIYNSLNGKLNLDDKYKDKTKELLSEIIKDSVNLKMFKFSYEERRNILRFSKDCIEMFQCFECSQLDDLSKRIKK